MLQSLSWSWNFGDGNTSNVQNPSHVFLTSDTFDVSLTVTDLDGCSRTITKNDFINILDTVSPVAVCQNTAISLDGTGNVSITATQVDGGSTDNCNIDTMYLDRYDFSVADFGMTFPVKLTVSDYSGQYFHLYFTGDDYR